MIKFCLILFVALLNASEVGYTISGIVKDEKTGAPILAAVVSIEKTSFRTASDQFGRYSLEQLPRGKYILSVEAGGYEKYSHKKLDLKNERVQNIDVSMKHINRVTIHSECDTCKKARFIVGLVSDAGGLPLKDISIRNGYNKTAVITDANGTFSINGGLPDSVLIMFEHPDFIPDSVFVDFSAGNMRDVNIRLKPKKNEPSYISFIRGMVHDDLTGNVLSKASLTFLNTGYKADSDSNGAYYFETIAPGKYTLLVTRFGYEAYIENNIDIIQGDTIEKDVRLVKRAAGAFSDSATGFITGVILDNEGKVVKDAYVWLANSTQLVTSGSAGEYKLDNVKSGTRTVMAYAPLYDTTASPETDVWPGEFSTVNVTLAKKKEETTEKRESVAFAKGKGAVSGVIVDAKNGNPVAGVTVMVSESKTIKSVSGLDGRYSIPNVNAGQLTLLVNHAGFQNEAQQVLINEGKESSKDFILKASDATELSKMSIRSVRVQNTGASLLKERQKAISFTDAIGSQEMSRGGAGNAAEAIKIVTGVTLEDDKYVIVRGMPKRYTLTMLNGSPLPSPDPNTKAVNMDLFPSGMVENITVYKTLTSNLPVDFSGGVVDIVTKPFPEKLDISFSLSSSYAAGSSLSNEFLTYKGGKLDLLAIDDGTRALPVILEQCSKVEIDKIMSLANYDPESNYITQRLANPNDKLADTLQLIDKLLGSLDHSEMSPSKSTVPVNTGISASVGNSFDLFDRQFGYRLSLNYSNKYSHSDDGIKNDYEEAFVAYNPYLEPPKPVKELNEVSSKHTVEWGVLGTAAYRINGQSNVTAEYIHIQNASDEVSIYKGKYPYFLTSALIDTYKTMQLHYIQRTIDYLHPVYKNTFKLGEQIIDMKQQLSLTLSKQEEPDLRDFQYNIEPRDTTTWYKIHSNYPEPSHKYRDLKEYAVNYKPEFKMPFYQWTDDSATLTVGADATWKSREVRERRFEYRSSNFVAKGQNQYYPPETFFVPESTGKISDGDMRNGYRWGILMRDMTEDISQWDGWQLFPSLYSMVELPVGNGMNLTTGLKVEYTMMGGASISERFREQTTVDLKAIKVLPAFSLSRKFYGNMSVRVAYGRTLAQPTLREIAEYPTSSFTGGKSFIGNKKLEISTIDNLDARWEWFMRPGELFAISPFFKRIQKPIEIRHFLEDYIQPNNAHNSAKIIGCEFEARKQITKQFQTSGNVTIAHSSIELDPLHDDGMVKSELYFPYEDKSRPFQGQSPLVVNLFLTYNNEEKGLNVNLIYNMFWKRLAEITSPETPWMWQETKNLINITATKKVTQKLEIKFKANNIINAIVPDLFNTEDKYFLEYQGKELLVYTEEPDWGLSLGLGYSF